MAIIWSCALAQAERTLASVVVRGSTVYTAAELFPLYQEQLGQPIARAGVGEVARRIADAYERDGYARPQVAIDERLIHQGVLLVDVHEARISAIIVGGDPGPHRATLEGLAARLQQQEGPLRPAELRATLRRMRELPGLALTAATVRDAAHPNHYVLELDARFQPVNASLKLTNRGTDEVGSGFLAGRVAVNGLSARTSAALLFVAASDYERYYGFGAGADTLVGGYGMRLSANVFRSRADPLVPLAGEGHDFLRDRLRLGVTLPRDAPGGGNALFTAFLRWEDLTIERSGSLLREERLRVVELASRWTWNNPGAAQSTLNVELLNGVDGFGSSLHAADLTHDPRRADFLLLRAAYARLMRIGEQWSLRLDAHAQHSAHALPYSERFKVGGERLGRGYKEPVLAGDRGVGGKAELRRSLSEAAGFLGHTSAFAFYDLGAVRRQDRAGGASAASAGIGLAARARRVAGQLELTRPLTHPDRRGRRDTQAFVEVTTQF